MQAEISADHPLLSSTFGTLHVLFQVPLRSVWHLLFVLFLFLFCFLVIGKCFQAQSGGDAVQGFKWQDLQKLQLIGQEAYWAEQREKKALLDFLLEHYNDGRRKSFFAVAVNLLELSDLNNVIQQLKQKFTYEASVKERAAQAVDLLQTLASERGIVCELRKKPGKK